MTNGNKWTIPMQEAASISIRFHKELSDLTLNAAYILADYPDSETIKKGTSSDLMDFLYMTSFRYAALESKTNEAIFNALQGCSIAFKILYNEDRDSKVKTETTRTLAAAIRMIFFLVSRASKLNNINDFEAYKSEDLETKWFIKEETK